MEEHVKKEVRKVLDADNRIREMIQNEMTELGCTENAAMLASYGILYKLVHNLKGDMKLAFGESLK
jgi:hypothetical protein